MPLGFLFGGFTMTILTKKRFCFRNGDTRYETQGNSIIEEAPDWVAKTELYEMAVKEGSILEVKSQMADAAIEKELAKKKK